METEGFSSRTSWEPGDRAPLLPDREQGLLAQAMVRAEMACGEKPLTPGSGCVCLPLSFSISASVSISVSLTLPPGVFVSLALCSVKGELE